MVIANFSFYSSGIVLYCAAVTIRLTNNIFDTAIVKQ